MSMEGSETDEGLAEVEGLIKKAKETEGLVDQMERLRRMRASLNAFTAVAETTAPDLWLEAMRTARENLEAAIKK